MKERRGEDEHTVHIWRQLPVGSALSLLSSYQINNSNTDSKITSRSAENKAKQGRQTGEEISDGVDFLAQSAGAVEEGVGVARVAQQTQLKVLQRRLGVLLHVQQVIRIVCFASHRTASHRTTEQNHQVRE